MRLLCVRAEWAAGLESPPEDAELRREYQMRRLVAAMGQGERRSPDEFEILSLEWLGVGATEPEACAALFARFDRATRRG
jgi:hypothetical protein